MNIEDISVYDPKIDGLDYVSYQNAYRDAASKNQKKAYALHDGLYKKCGASKLKTGENLVGFLYGREGYFARNPDKVAVIFLDGKFHSALTQGEYYNESFSADNLARERNSFPFLFLCDKEVEQYLQTREATESARSRVKKPKA